MNALYGQVPSLVTKPARRPLIVALVLGFGTLQYLPVQLTGSDTQVGYQTRQAMPIGHHAVS